MATITHKSGNSLNAGDLTMQVTKNGVPVDLTGKTVVYRLFTETPTDFAVGSGLTLLNATLGTLQLTGSRSKMTIPAGQYRGALRVTDPGDADFELELPNGTDPDDATDADIWEIQPEHIT